MSNEAHEAAAESVNEMLFGGEESEAVEPDGSEEASLEVVEEAELEGEEGDQDEVEADTEGQAEEADSEGDLHEVAIGENLYEVPLEIKEAIDKSNDYTQKTQAVSAERKTLEVVQESLATQQKEYEFVDSINDEVAEAMLIKSQIAQWQQHKRDSVDTLSDRELMKISMEIEALQTRGKAISDSVTLKHQEHQQAAEQSRKELRDKSTEVLNGKIPNWEARKPEVVAFAQSVGFTDQELDNAVDPREWEILYKAQQYDKLQAGKSAAIQKVQSAPIKAKARNPMPDSVKSRLNTRKKLKTKGLSNKDKSTIIQDDIAKRLGLN